jgi:inner membrane protein
MEQQQPINPASLPGFFDRNRMLIKGFFIGFLILIMLIPVVMLSELVSERQQRQQQVTEEISSKWASAQTIVGPIIMLPYYTRTDSSKTIVRKYIYLMPDRLDVNGKVFPEVRHRSLYDVTLYRSDLQLTGMFDPAALQKLAIPPGSISWSEAQFVLGLNDVRGLEDNIALQWDTVNTSLEAGIPNNTVVQTGLGARVMLTPEKTVQFRVSVKLKGSSYLYFTPVGKTTEVALNSTWKDPAFDGQYLPAHPAVITDSGFSARWKVLQVSRSYPQAWTDASTFDITASAFGVKLLQPTDRYAKTERSVKYAMLIIALTFTIFFFVEIFQKRQVHPLQYILVGIALCVFYTLLLSISEYTGFNTAYLIASLATVLLISTYVQGIFRQLKIAAGFFFALAALYTYIYILIQLQDYALLAGSIGIFVILAVIMYFSRKIDWYATAKTVNR